MAPLENDDPEPSHVAHARSGIEARLTLADVPGVMARARRDLARLLRVFAGRQSPEIARVLWEVAAVFEAQRDDEEAQPRPPAEKPPAEP